MGIAGMASICPLCGNMKCNCIKHEIFDPEEYVDNRYRYTIDKEGHGNLQFISYDELFNVKREQIRANRDQIISYMESYLNNPSYKKPLELVLYHGEHDVDLGTYQVTVEEILNNIYPVP
jgi:hypothetical protein